MQVYYTGTDTYKQLPGEFGLAYNSNITTYNQLQSSYTSPSFSNDTTRQEFIEARMREDAQAMGFSISDYFKATNVNGTPKLVLPTGFNESTGRIIAMTTKYYTQNNNKSNEFHFYLRNGNSSCPTHSGNCSMWSHKRGTMAISNTSIEENELLCDQNIAEYIGDDGYSSDARYYIISKNTIVYNAWHSAHPSSGPTPYQQ